jgi:hypothetical protein
LQSVSFSHPTLSAGGVLALQPHAIASAAKRAAVVARAILRSIGNILPVTLPAVAAARGLFTL